MTVSHGSSLDRVGRDADLAAVTLASLGGGAVVTIPERPGVTSAWPAWVAAQVREAFQRAGVAEPWAHQVRAADLAHQGEHVVLATGTASGKSIGYWLPALTAIVTHDASVLYVTPTKALAQDQRSRLAALGLEGLVPSTYDGDTDREARPYVRRTANFLLTNPDMLHRSLLPGHAQWASFLRRLRYVVIDEGHHYRGVFGSHVAAVIRRLRKVAASYGSEPTFLVCSATTPQPEIAGRRLLGVPVVAVCDDTSSRAQTTLILHDPLAVPAADDAAATEADPRSAFLTATEVMADWAVRGVSALGFMRSRNGVESLAAAVRERLPESVRGTVTAYRGGLLPEERRAIETALRSGSLRVVAATNAMELGVDISGLDAVAMIGWPGTRLSFLQQLGRAGRAGQPATAVLIAGQDPLDRYLIAHPERILADPLEAFVFDPGNPYVLGPHLAAAVAEAPLTDTEAVALFGPAAPGLLITLADAGLVRRRADHWYWVARGRASDLADLRGTGQPVLVVESGSGRVMGTVDRSSATAQVHAGAVYVHLGRVHVIGSLDLEQGVAVAVPGDPRYTTVAQSVSDLAIRSRFEQQSLPGGALGFGEVEVISQVVGYVKRHAGTGRFLGSVPLALPPARLVTKAVWWEMDQAHLVAAGLHATDVPGAAHAAEHAAIGMLPALATCDRWDIGGLSTAHHRDTGAVTVFVHDGHPGGAGFAERGFRVIDEWLAATREVIASCTCQHGCPGCVQSPKCGNGNEPLDKDGAVLLLDLLLHGRSGDPPVGPTSHTD